MRGRFWRKVIIKRGNNVAYPQTNDSFRATENRPGIKYDPAKKTTLFAEDLKALGDSIISVQNALGNFNLNEQGSISNRVYALPWDATIRQSYKQFKIVPIFSRAVVIKGIVQAIAYYKAPDQILLPNIYIKSPVRALNYSIDKVFYGLNSVEFNYHYDKSNDQYFGHGAVMYNPSNPGQLFIQWQKSETGDSNVEPQAVSEKIEVYDGARRFIKDSIIKVKLEYPTND